ncbi:polysaccharide deacetylase family protein [Microbispora sp. NEAU-D428]|uniref:polysaccharide deacetylase family protein n=1 Tax=Microbispora sitophila TaxID=2771537 RepID=UPI0018686667|nr:polysaccharide deacetylase family protein [Microbispora sitophila]MBE3013426.1 polysaccharide deacetylase family protein [Microbispora sitophila]
MRLTVKRLLPVCLLAAASIAGLQHPAAATAGSAVSAQAAPARVAEQGARAAGVPTVVLTFDDGTADHLAVAGMLSRRGLKGTFYVNSARLGRRGFLSVAELRAIAKQGHEIGGHTLHHPHLPETFDATQQTEICDDRRALLKMGFAVRSFAYPFGDFDESGKQIAMRCGYNSARDINGLYRPDSCRACPVTETIPPADPAAVRATSQTRLPRTARTLREFVTRAQREDDPGMLTFVFHEIKNDPRDEYATAPKEFAAFVDWVAQQRKAKKIDVKTMGDVVGGDVSPVS